MAQYHRKLKKGIRWYYKFDFKSKTYFSQAIYLSKIEAKQAENTKYGEISNKVRNPSRRPILSLLEAINSRLDYVKVKKSKKYYDENKTYYKLLIDHFGDISIESIRKTDINNLLLGISSDLKGRGFDNYKVNSILRISKALFNHAIEEYDLNIKNPCVGIKPFSVKRKLKYIPPDDDIISVLEKCDNDERLLIFFVEETACRISEALRLTEADIFPDYIVLYTRKSRNSDLVPRKITKPTCLKELNLKQSERVFSRWTTYPKFLEETVKALKQKRWSWHNLRHRKASLMSKEGKPLFDIMSLLGHSNLKTTQGYLQLLS